jgi:hypothetical protein
MINLVTDDNCIVIITLKQLNHIIICSSSSSRGISSLPLALG